MPDLNEQAALKIMGWVIIDANEISIVERLPNGQLVQIKQDEPWRHEDRTYKQLYYCEHDNHPIYKYIAVECVNSWQPDKDYNQLRQLQEKVIEDGKWKDYFNELWLIVDNYVITPYPWDVFKVATPAQHIEAMLKCYE